MVCFCAICRSLINLFGCNKMEKPWALYAFVRFLASSIFQTTVVQIAISALCAVSMWAFTRLNLLLSPYNRQYSVAVTGVTFSFFFFYQTFDYKIYGTSRSLHFSDEERDFFGFSKWPGKKVECFKLCQRNNFQLKERQQYFLESFCVMGVLFFSFFFSFSAVTKRTTFRTMLYSNVL